MAWTRTSTSTSTNALGAAREQEQETWTRPLGDSEYAFHAYSHTGVGDMFLHIAFIAPPSLLARERMLIAWSTLLLRHPLLLSSVVLPDPNGEGDDELAAHQEPYFSFTVPGNKEELLEAARRRLTFEQCSKSEWIDRYMNGPRALDDTCISRLTIVPSSSRSHEAVSDGKPVPNGVTPRAPAEEARQSYDLYLCAPHFSGDALPLHQSAHDLLVLLASPQRTGELLHALEQDLKGMEGRWDTRLPLPVEALLALPPEKKLARAAAQVNYLQSQAREVGGHVLPRKQRGPMRTILLERGFSVEQTRRILQRCKERGVSANHAVFALVDVAWARMLHKGFELPIMNYTALSLRPYFQFSTPELEKSMSYWFVALTYFNIVLPSFLPSSAAAPCGKQRHAPEGSFWERTRSARDQIARITQSKFLVHRARMMGAQRAERAGRTFALDTASPATAKYGQSALLLSPPSDALEALAPRSEPAPSKALMGISLMGNLDKVYLASEYPEITLLDVATASRQKPGGILLLAHTFAGRMWLHMAYDENGFEEGTMERFWSELRRSSEELLIGL